MSWQATVWALKTRVGDPTLKILLLAIANYADADGSCFPRNETLAFDSEVSKRTIQRSLEKLVNLGLIKITQRFDKNGRQTTAQFDLIMDESRGDKLAIDKLTPPDSVMGRVTPNCHGEGDNKVSPTESLERSYELSIEQENKCPSLLLGCTDEQFSLETEPVLEAVALSKKDEAELFFDKKFWPAYPKRFGSNPKEPAKKKIVAAILKGEKPAEILSGVNRLYAGLQRSGKIGTEFVPMALTWINRKQWKDDPLPAGDGKARGEKSFFELAQESYQRAEEYERENGTGTDQNRW